jgi:hypothetical protein
MTFDKGQSTQLVEKNYWMDKICPEPGVYYNVSSCSFFNDETILDC